MKVKTSDLVLIVASALTIIFTAIMIWLFYTHYSIPDTLVTCWFGAVAGEFGVLGWIKNTKIRHEDRRWQNEDYKKFKEDQK